MAEKKARKSTKVVEAPVNVADNTDIVDIDLSATRKKRFRIDGDNNRILELNTSDMNVVSRLTETYPKLVKMVQDAANQNAIKTNKTDATSLELIADTTDKIDKSMREAIDYIFDANVSAICAPEGTMYDPFNGTFRYEHIIEKLAKLYENNMETEYQKLSARIQKHTSKYIK